MRKLFVRIAGILAVSLAPVAASADTAAEIDANVSATIQKFEASLSSGSHLIDEARGVLVFPEVIKGGFVVGAEYGEGSLQISGQTKNYYSVTAGSFGLQIGAQKKSVMFLFMTDESLSNFRNRDGWDVGLDASIAIINLGDQDSINTIDQDKPVLAFVLDQKGLMANVTMEGSKITRIER